MKKKIALLTLVTFVSTVLYASSVNTIGGGSSSSLPDQTGNSGKYLTTDGSSASWASLSGSGITSLGGLTGATQTFAVGTSGTDFAISSSGTTHTFNLPDAGASARGAVTTGAQVFAGAKRFQDNLYVGSAPSEALPLNVDATMTTASGVYFGGNIIGRRSVSTTDSATSYGNLGQTVLTVSSGQSAHGVTAGLLGEAKPAGAGTTDFAAGVRGVVTNTGTGGVTEAAALVAGTIVNSGGGSVTNTYGLYLNNQTVGTNNYPIYSNGTKESYFVAGSSLASGKFFVSNEGNLSKVNNVYYNWPASQGSASTVLTNDGSGNLSWASSGSSGANTTLSNLTDTVAINKSLLFGTDNTYDIGAASGSGNAPRTIYSRGNSSSGLSFYFGDATTSYIRGYSGPGQSIALIDLYTSFGGAGKVSIGTVNSVFGSSGVYIGSTYLNYGVHVGSYGIEMATTKASDASSKTSIWWQTDDVASTEIGRDPGGTNKRPRAIYVGSGGLNSGGTVIADNQATTSNIFTGNDNGSSVFQVRDGGSTVIGAHAGTATHVVNGTIKVGRQAPLAAVALTDGATVALDASLGNVFDLVAGGDRTLLAPTNPIDGQKIILRHKASGANRTLTLTTGAGGFAYGSDITTLTATTSGATDYIGFMYNLASNRWHVISVSKGLTP